MFLLVDDDVAELMLERLEHIGELIGMRQILDASCVLKLQRLVQQSDQFLLDVLHGLFPFDGVGWWR